MTRYIKRHNIDYVFHKRGDKSKQQPIDNFHNELADLKFLRIDELAIGNYLAPNSILLNQLYCRACEFGEMYRIAEENKAEKTNHMANIESTLRICSEANITTRERLNAMRTYQYGINQQGIGNIIEAHPNVEQFPRLRDDIMSQTSELALKKQFQMKQDARQTRINQFKATVERQIDYLTEKATNSLDYTNAHNQVEDRFNQLLDGLQTYTEELHERSRRQVANYEFAEMQAMYRRMRHHMNNTKFHIDQCDIALNHFENIKTRILDGSRLNSIDMLNEKKRQLMNELHGSIDAIKLESNKLGDLAMDVNNAKLTA